jgi:hypothetical protein
MISLQRGIQKGKISRKDAKYRQERKDGKNGWV